MKPRHSSSVFWEYVFICTSLTLVACVCLFAVLGSSYLRTINSHSEASIQNQADRAVSALDDQVESMHQLSLRLSTQSIYRYSYFRNSKYAEYLVAQSLSQYQSYCPLADRFALMFRSPEGSVTLFQNDGTTADLDVFLAQYQLTDSDTVLEFLFRQQDQARVLQMPSGILVAFTVSSNISTSDEDYGILCFAILNDHIQNHVSLSSALDRESYRLVYRQKELIPLSLVGNVVSSGDETGFRIDVPVPDISLLSLLSDPHDIALLILCLAVISVCIFAIAWQCYRPIRSLAQKYASDTPSDVRNELFLLEQTITEIQSRSLVLDQETTKQSALLQNYVLLMMLNSSGAINIVPELSKVGITFPYPYFAVLTLMPLKGQVITPKNTDTILQSIPDIAGDDSIIYCAECNQANHILAIVCNLKKAEEYDLIFQRLHTYLNIQDRQFLIGKGTITDTLVGISASYLSSLAQLRELSSSLPDPDDLSEEASADTGVLINRIMAQIECGDCQRALLNLESYIEVLEHNQSELIRRYNVMTITHAIQLLCTKLNFQLTESQMSMLLSMRSVQSIHFSLLQMIPTLCAHAQKQNDQAILPTGRLVMDYLQAHFCDYDISTQKIAEAIGIGVNRTSTIIREETGHSLKTVLTQLRVRHAKKLLLDNSLSLTDISSQVGYSSASYFIKVFKASEGITPDAYRKGFSPEAPESKDQP